MRGLFVAALLAWAAVASAQGEDRTAALDRAYGELQAAYTALQQAEAARESGIGPLPGERIAIVSAPGRRQSRLSDEYWERQRRLQDEVEEARARVERAQARWNELR